MALSNLTAQYVHLENWENGNICDKNLPCYIQGQHQLTLSKDWLWLKININGMAYMIDALKHKWWMNQEWEANKNELQIHNYPISKQTSNRQYTNDKWMANEQIVNEWQKNKRNVLRQHIW